MSVNNNFILRSHVYNGLECGQYHYLHCSSEDKTKTRWKV